MKLSEAAALMARREAAQQERREMLLFERRAYVEGLEAAKLALHPESDATVRDALREAVVKMRVRRLGLDCDHCGEGLYVDRTTGQGGCPGCGCTMQVAPELMRHPWWEGSK